MSSLFDSAEFNQRLFFRRKSSTPCPPGARDSFVEVEPGIRLHARTHLNATAFATLVFFHGNGETVGDYDELAARFTALGLEVVFFDYRGYGQSNGVPTLRALYADAVKCIATVERTRPVVLFGRSLGAAASAELAGRDGLIDGLVLESGGSNLAALVARRGFPPYTLSDEERGVFDPVVKLSRCRVPALVLHGRNDDLILPREAEAAFAALASQDKQLVFVPGGHNDLSFSREYWDALATFVAKWK
ncbi:MAG: alpha/beta fold hydrolase [Archangium sp.]